MYPQPAKRIASPSMYADCRFQHTLHALRCSSLRHCILSRDENEFKEAPSMNPCLENNKGADKSVPSAYSLFCDPGFSYRKSPHQPPGGLFEGSTYLRGPIKLSEKCAKLCKYQSIVFIVFHDVLLQDLETWTSFSCIYFAR